MQFKKIQLPLLDTCLWVGAAATDEDFVRGRKRFGDQDEDPCDGIYIRDGDEHAVVFHNDALDTSLVVHEIFHATHGILDNAGHRFDPDNHEIFARMAEFLYRETCKLLNVTL